MTEFSTRSWQPDDEAHLWDMLYASIHVRVGQAPPPRAILDEPSMAHYLTGFGRREGDDAEIAVDAIGSAIGAAWCRTLPADDPGYGFVAADVPELGMAVVAPWRGRGVGTRLLDELLGRHPVMSLSVDDENAATERLYERVGFRLLRVDGTSRTMIRRP